MMFEPEGTPLQSALSTLAPKQGPGTVEEGTVQRTLQKMWPCQVVVVVVVVVIVIAVTI